MAKTNINNSAQTATEILISVVIACLIFASALGAFLLIRNAQNYSVAEYNLQRDANILINRITRNLKEGSSLHGLRAGKSFTIPNTAEIDYISADDSLRRYYLSGNSIVYVSPAQWPNSRTIYTAPPNSTLCLRFWEPVGYLDRETVGIYIGIVRQVVGKTVSGSVSTYVNLRNVPK